MLRQAAARASRSPSEKRDLLCPRAKKYPFRLLKLTYIFMISSHLRRDRHPVHLTGSSTTTDNQTSEIRQKACEV